MRQTFQKLIGACCKRLVAKESYEAASTYALLICMFMIVIQVAREPFERVLKVKDFVWPPTIVTKISKVSSSITYSFATIFEKSITPFWVVSC